MQLFSGMGSKKSDINEKKTDQAVAQRTPTRSELSTKTCRSRAAPACSPAARPRAAPGLARTKGGSEK